MYGHNYGSVEERIWDGIMWVATKNLGAIGSDKDIGTRKPEFGAKAQFLYI